MLEENQFGDILKSLRNKKGKVWTQKKTAELLGVSERTYKSWENGKRIPSEEYRKAIVAIFELDEPDEAMFYRVAAQVPPKINNLPSPPNLFFTGRKAYLEQLDELLKENKSVAITQTVSISGLGGIGKTQLALEYAHRSYRNNTYRAIFWVDAAEITTIETSYILLAHILALPEKDDNETDYIVKAVKQWLEDHTNWLLIMDNADDLHLARSYFPVTHQGHILLTTRSQIVGNISRQIEIDKMESEEGLLFLLRRSHIIQDETGLNTVSIDTRHAAQQLVELLGGHALALNQAGAYIEETGVSCSEYIKLFHEYRDFLLRRQGSLEEALSGSSRSVAAIITLSIDKACERQPMARDILYFFSLLQPDAIPDELLQCDDIFKLNMIAFNEGIAALQKYSLVKRNMGQKTFSMHRLVQVVLNDSTSIDLQKELKTRVIRTLSAAIPQVDMKIGQSAVNQWGQWDHLLPHVLVCAAWSEDELFSIREATSVFYGAGKYLLTRHNNTFVEQLAGLALSIWRHHVKTDDYISANLLDLLAVSYELSKNPLKVEQGPLLRQQALAIYERLLDADDPDIILSLAITSTPHIGQKSYVQTEELYLRVLSVFEKQLGADSTKAALTLCQLGNIYMLQQKYIQAEEVLERAHKIFESEAHIYNPDRSLPLFSLIILRQSQQNYEEARILYYRWISIEEQRTGADHPDIAHFKELFSDLFNS